MILLMHPPVGKPSEPPAGIARLSGLLRDYGIDHRIADLNIEGLLYLLEKHPAAAIPEDTWSRRAMSNRSRHLSSMRDPALYRNLDRYRRSVKDLGRALATVSGGEVGLAQYEHAALSPLRSSDLIAAAETPGRSVFHPFFRTRMAELCREKTPDAVGISLNYLGQALCAFSLIGLLRKELPRVKIFLGGGLVTSWMRNMGGETPFSGLVDCLVAGPGEDRLPSLLGLAAAAPGFPMPDYGQLRSNRYLSPEFVLPYSASSGCYWKRCGFCPERAEGSPYRPVPVAQAIGDIAALSQENRPGLLHLLDNAVSPALLAALGAHPPGVPWYGFVRIDDDLADPDFCISLKRAGCVMVKLGVESGDQGVLDAMEKGIRLETVSAALKGLKRAGIATYVYLIFGTPPETEGSAGKTLEFTVRHAHLIDFLNLAVFSLPRCGGTAAVETMSFSEGDLSLYTDFVHPGGWDRKRVRLFLGRRFKIHPAIAPIVRRDPPVFTSNHAPFFVMNGQT